MPNEPATTDRLHAFRMVVGGERRAGRGEQSVLVEPWSGQPFATVEMGTTDDLDDAVFAAAAAFDGSGWATGRPLDRAAVLGQVASTLRARTEEIGALEARNVGRPLAECRHNVELAADAFAYFASLSTHLRGASIPIGSGLLDYSLREPYGVCGLITPWNNPIVLSSWKIAAGLAAGNALVVKPASATPLSVLIMADLLEEAGLPGGVLNVVPGPGGQLGDHLAAHPGVRKVSFTGSTATGIHVLQRAAPNLAKVSLELGGKSPSLVFADAEMDAAISGSVPAMFSNAGQMCTARSRILVQRSRYDEFLDRFVDRVGQLKMGSPFDEAVTLGPLISPAQVDTVLRFIERAKADGARIVCGGGRPSDPMLAAGNFVEPTVITGVKDDMEIVTEEVFGPVVVVEQFDDEDEVVRRVNASRYGLAATVWTRDLALAHRVAAVLQAGTVTINTTKVSHVYAPFGGYKQSGLGRELGLEGLDEFLQVKNVIVSTV